MKMSEQRCQACEQELATTDETLKTGEIVSLCLACAIIDT